MLAVSSTCFQYSSSISCSIYKQFTSDATMLQGISTSTQVTISPWLEDFCLQYLSSLVNLLFFHWPNPLIHLTLYKREGRFLNKYYAAKKLSRSVNFVKMVKPCVNETFSMLSISIFLWSFEVRWVVKSLLHTPDLTFYGISV